MRIASIFSTCSIFFLSLNACNTDPSEIGANFFQSGSLDIINVDTMTLRVSTVQYDEVVTSLASRLLVGHHNDAKVGAVSCSSFIELSALIENTTYEELTPENSKYLRTTLTLTYDGYSYYDTTESQTIRVHRVTEEIEPEENESYLYNNSNFLYDATALGELTFKPRPGTRDTLEVPLSDALGETLMTWVWEGNEVLYTQNDFSNFIKGLVAIPSTNVNGSIIGFGTAPELRVYYTDNTVVPAEEKYLAFGVEQYFNKIFSDRGLLALNDLQTLRYPLLSGKTDNEAYIQSSVGMALRVEIPYLKNILVDNKDLIITSATLQFSPIAKTYSDNTVLPSSLTMYQVDDTNDVLFQYALGPYLYEDIYLGRNTYYSVDIGEFLSSQLAIQEFNSNALLFRFADATFQSTVDRLCIGDGKNEYEMKLNINYAIIKE